MNGPAGDPPGRRAEGAAEGAVGEGSSGGADAADAGDGLEAELAALEHRIGRLADLCARLDLENRSLREQQRVLVEERARLIEKNDTARSKVEQMIVRLRSLEAGQ